MTVSIECRCAECRYAKCHDYLNVMRSVIMLNVIMLNVIILNVGMLNIVMLNVVMLNVVMLSIGPIKKTCFLCNFSGVPFLLGSPPYLQTLDSPGKACQGQTLELIRPIRKLQIRTFFLH